MRILVRAKLKKRRKTLSQKEDLKLKQIASQIGLNYCINWTSTCIVKLTLFDGSYNRLPILIVPNVIKINTFVVFFLQIVKIKPVCMNLM
jgi:hypothetical protein